MATMTKNQHAIAAVKHAGWTLDSLAELESAPSPVILAVWSHALAAYIHAVDAVRADGTFHYGQWHDDAMALWNDNMVRRDALLKAEAEALSSR